MNERGVIQIDVIKFKLRMKIMYELSEMIYWAFLTLLLDVFGEVLLFVEAGVTNLSEAAS